MKEPTNSEIRIDTGRSQAGTFVRVTHLPSGITRVLDPIGDSNPYDVTMELKSELMEFLESASPRFSVWRLDDNGNEFLIRNFWNNEDAESYRDEMTARGHKQTYWVTENDT
ncbi:MAG: hypothetical protein AAF431_07525 [Pseudomonadota bacterium]